MPKKKVPSRAELLKEFGSVGQYYDDPEEVEHHREAWKSTRDGVIGLIQAAYKAPKQTAISLLRKAKMDEKQWGDWPMTMRHAAILGVRDDV